MATNTILQSLNPVEDGSGVTSSFRRQIESFIAAEAIVANDLVAVDLSQTEDGDKALYVVQADTGTATDTLAVGFALTDAASGEVVDVTVAGIHVSANVDGATAAGSRLIVGSTAGRASVAADIDEGGSATVEQRPIIAIAAEADTSNVATVFVLKQF